MGRKKFLLNKCPAECDEKGGAIVVKSLVPRLPRDVTALPPNSVAVCVCVRVRVRGSSTTSVRYSLKKIQKKPSVCVSALTNDWLMYHIGDSNPP